MNKRLAAVAILVTAIAAAAGLFAGTSSGASLYQAATTGAGLSPSTLRHASDTIRISGAGCALCRNGQIDFGGSASPFKQISFSAGSNWHFTGIKSFSGANGSVPTGKCSLTPTNGGATCSFANPLTSVIDGKFYFVTTISSDTPPTAVAGKVVYADDSTATFAASVINYPPTPNLAPASVSDAVFTGLTKGKPGVAFKLDGGGENNTATFTSFDVTLPRGLRFNRKQVMQGTACHGPGKWKSSAISAKQMRCTPRAPLPFAERVTNIRISAIHEDNYLEREVEQHKVMKLPFYLTVAVPHHRVWCHVRGRGTIKN
jgi:hypothetical protein